MELTHVTRNLRITPRKLRLVADQIRHMHADRALQTLPLVPNKGAGLAYKSLQAAVQVAVDRNAARESLVIRRVWCDEGRKLKRGVHRSKGRSLPITKHYSHLSIVLVGEEAVRRRAAKAQPEAAAEKAETVEKA